MVTRLLGRVFFGLVSRFEVFKAFLCFVVSFLGFLRSRLAVAFLYILWEGFGQGTANCRRGELWWGMRFRV